MYNSGGMLKARFIKWSVKLLNAKRAWGSNDNQQLWNRIFICSGLLSLRKTIMSLWSCTRKLTPLTYIFFKKKESFLAESNRELLIEYPFELKL